MELNSISFANHDSCEALTSSVRDIAGLLGLEQRKSFRCGELLWIALDMPTQVFVLQEGRVEITETDRAGRSLVTQIVRPGDVFGYLCFCDHRFEPQGTEARATAQSTVLRIEYEAFRRRLKRSSSAAICLTEALCNRVADLERRARVLAIHDAQQRLGTLLHQLATANLVTERVNRKRVVVHATHAELASRAALTRPHTTVLMTRLRGLGCVTYKRGSAITVDLAKLAVIVG